MPAKSDPRDEVGGSKKYFYRRSLSVRETLPAIGLAVAAGLAAFYVGRLFIQRTPLTSGDRVVRRRDRNQPTRDS